MHLEISAAKSQRVTRFFFQGNHPVNQRRGDLDFCDKKSQERGVTDWGIFPDLSC
jgi:hypothetical protein